MKEVLSILQLKKPDSPNIFGFSKRYNTLRSENIEMSVLAKLNPKHINIPVFLPEKSCPYKCIYCNQHKITGIKSLPSVVEIQDIIENHLHTINSKDTFVEIAFFGGNFTGIPLPEQEKLLSSVQHFIVDKHIKSIRVSTRPDYINTEVLDLLKKYNVNTIELGIQSMDNDVLRASGRGYTADEVKEKAALVKAYGFDLCLQMMIGLPGDTIEKSLATAHQIIRCNASMTRIYPLLVIKDTTLESLFLNGKYTPLSLSDAVLWTREVYKLFWNAHVKVLKMGLHPSKDLMYGDAVIAGPFHPSFAEMVFSSIWQEKLSSVVPDNNLNLKISVCASDYNHAIGYKASNKKLLSLKFKTVKFAINNRLNRFELNVDYS